MEKIKLTPPTGVTPITEADLHAYADQQLAAARRADVERFLSTRPDERRRVQDWQKQNESLRNFLNPVLDEPLPLRLPLRPEAMVWPWRGLAAGVAIAVVSASSAWFARGLLDGNAAQLASMTTRPVLAYKGGDLKSVV